MRNLCSTQQRNYDGPITIFAISQNLQSIREIPQIYDIDPTRKKIIQNLCRERKYSPQKAQNFMLVFHNNIQVTNLVIMSILKGFPHLFVSIEYVLPYYFEMTPLNNRNDVIDENAETGLVEEQTYLIFLEHRGIPIYTVGVQ